MPGRSNSSSMSRYAGRRHRAEASASRPSSGRPSARGTASVPGDRRTGSRRPRRGPGRGVSAATARPWQRRRTRCKDRGCDPTSCSRGSSPLPAANSARAAAYVLSATKARRMVGRPAWASRPRRRLLWSSPASRPGRCGSGILRRGRSKSGGARPGPCAPRPLAGRRKGPPRRPARSSWHRP